MERAIKPLTPEMKKELAEKKLISIIDQKIHPYTLMRTKFPPSRKKAIVLPEGFTGRDLKRVKRLMRKKDKKNLKKSIK